MANSTGRRRLGRGLGATSVLTLLMALAILLSGVSVAVADTMAMLFQSINASLWSPPSNEPSGAAYVADDDYLLVVDTNYNVPSQNGWQVDRTTGSVTNRSTGVDEPTGVDYHPGTDTLFVTDDDGFIYVIRNFDEVNESRTVLDVSSMSEDTEDPAIDQVNNVLYFVDGGAQRIFRIDPGANETFEQADVPDPTPAPSPDWFDISHLNEADDADWESLAWDPRTENLLVGNRLDRQIYEVFKTDGGLINTIQLGSIQGLGYISGLGVAPASYNENIWSVWVTDRDTSRIFELTVDGTVPPSTTSTSTTSTQPTTTTTGATTTTTQGTTTTTAASTTTTIPGNTTTTTVPNNPPPNPNPGEFSDTNGHVFENAISWLSDKGITKGCNPPANTEFCPDDFVTRGQMAAFLVRAFGYTADGGGDLFTDDDASVFESAIDRLRTAGVTQGCNPPTNSRFCPDGLVTRGQMAAFLGRAFEYTNDGGGDWFIDDNGSVFEGAIDRLRTAGVTQGCNPPLNNRYCPDDFVTRGQMAAFLKRAFGE